jgi:hypothetical protein
MPIYTYTYIAITKPDRICRLLGCRQVTGGSTSCANVEGHWHTRVDLSGSVMAGGERYADGASEEIFECHLPKLLASTRTAGVRART